MMLVSRKSCHDGYCGSKGRHEQGPRDVIQKNFQLINNERASCYMQAGISQDGIYRDLDICLMPSLCKRRMIGCQ